MYAQIGSKTSRHSNVERQNGPTRQAVTSPCVVRRGSVRRNLDGGGSGPPGRRVVHDEAQHVPGFDALESLFVVFDRFDLPAIDLLDDLALGLDHRAADGTVLIILHDHDAFDVTREIQ